MSMLWRQNVRTSNLNSGEMTGPKGCSESKSMTYLELLEDEFRPGVVNTPQELSFTEVKTVVLVKQLGKT